MNANPPRRRSALALAAVIGVTAVLAITALAASGAFAVGPAAGSAVSGVPTFDEPDDPARSAGAELVRTLRKIGVAPASVIEPGFVVSPPTAAPVSPPVAPAPLLDRSPLLRRGPPPPT